MPFVIDASIAACWLMPDEQHPAADEAFARLAEDKALVPGLWWFEIRNVFLTGERRGRIDRAKTSEALGLLAELPIRVDRGVEDGPLLGLARRHRLTVYDAAYLELALRAGVALASLDAELVHAAGAEGVRVVGAAH